MTAWYLDHLGGQLGTACSQVIAVPPFLKKHLFVPVPAAADLFCLRIAIPHDVLNEFFTFMTLSYFHECSFSKESFRQRSCYFHNRCDYGEERFAKVAGILSINQQGCRRVMDVIKEKGGLPLFSWAPPSEVPRHLFFSRLLTAFRANRNPG
ncbi:hypothetical protein Tcan_00116 [Toxocara canis]|uniref:Uncharacterized protein n=1 Tax=Toxocara canis TaxID=6265 RepID=A0A0B2UTJ4_TOXCA|nr:hypothetical protein Tcan_00116 [Toxocara canis]